DRGLGAREAARDQPRDRNRHVRAQCEQLAALVEELVGGPRSEAVAAGQHLVVLDRGGRDLAVAVLFEDADQRGVKLAQLAHLIGQDVPGPRWNRVDHPPDLTRVGAKSLLRRYLGRNPLDLRAEGVEALVDLLVAAIDLADVPDLRDAI